MPATTVDWKQPASEVSFTGAPKWYAQMKENLLARLEAISQQKLTPYGQSEDGMNAIKEEEKRLEHQAKLIETPYAIPFSVTGLQEPVLFTPSELERASKDERFARRIYEKATGIAEIPKQDVSEFRNRIIFNLPDLPEMAETQRRDELQKRDEVIRGNNNQFLEYRNKVADNDREYKAKLAEYKIARGKFEKENAPAKLHDLLREADQLASDVRRETGFISKITDNDTPDKLIERDRHTALYQVKGNKLLEKMNEIKRLTNHEKDNPDFAPLIKLSDDFSGPRSKDYRKFVSYVSKVGDIVRASPFYESKTYLPAPVEPVKPSLGPKPDDLPLPKEDTEEALFERLSVPLAKRSLDLNHGRVAPMNQLHDQARRLVQRNIGTDDESFDLAKKELNAASKRDISGSTRDLVREALRPTHETSQQYRNPYQRNVIDALRSEARQNFLEDVLPNIHGNFTAAGAFHSGAHNAELHKFAQKSQLQLNREIAKMLHQNHEGSLTRAAEHSDRTMNAAHLMGNAEKAAQEANLKAAEAARNQGIFNKEIAKHDAASISQLAHQQQVQEQNAINARREAESEAQLEPLLRVERYANAVAGHPAPVQMGVSAHQASRPTPPNPYNVGAGILGQMAGLHQQAHQGHKKGGTVKRKFADGGNVNGFHALGQQVQPSHYDHEIESLASGLKNYRVQPMQNWLQHVSAQMLANNRGDPLSNMGIGAMRAEEHMNHHRDRMLDSQAKAANLYNAMNKSRQDQQSLLADYEHRQEARDEQRRHNNAVEGLQAQKIRQQMMHQMAGPSEMQQLNLEHKRAQIDALKSKNEPQEIQIGDTVIKPKMKISLTPQDRMVLEKIRKERGEDETRRQPYLDMLHFLEEHKNKKDLPSTGVIAAHSPEWALSDTDLEFRRKQASVVKGGILPGQRGKAFLEQAKEEKPTSRSKLENHEKFSKEYKLYWDDKIERNALAEDYASTYEIPPRITFTAYDRWAKDGKKGNFTDYIQAILEQKGMPSSRGSDDSMPDAPEMDGLSRRQTLQAELQRRQQNG